MSDIHVFNCYNNPDKESILEIRKLRFKDVKMLKSHNATYWFTLKC